MGSVRRPVTRCRVARGGGTARGGGAAAPAVWGRRRAGTACACCARYSTSWSPASSNSCLVDDVIAVEDGAALVPGQEHGDALGDVRADQVARGGAAAVVKEAGRHPGRLTGGAPRPCANGGRGCRRGGRRAGCRGRGVPAAAPGPRRWVVRSGESAPPSVFERAGESRMTPPALSISSQVRPRISCLRQPE